MYLQAVFDQSINVTPSPPGGNHLLCLLTSISICGIVCLQTPKIHASCSPSGSSGKIPKSSSSMGPLSVLFIVLTFVNIYNVSGLNST